MFKQLRWKFTVIAVVSISVVFAVLVFSINAIYRIVANHGTDELLTIIAENRGHIPDYTENKTPIPGFWGTEITEETPYETRYFVVWVNDDLDIVETQMEFIAAVTGEDVNTYFEQAAKSGQTYGYIGDYRFYKCTDYDNTLFVFLDCGNQLHTFRNFLNHFNISCSDCPVRGCSFGIFVILKSDCALAKKRGAAKTVHYGCESRNENTSYGGCSLRRCFGAGK